MKTLFTPDAFYRIQSRCECVVMSGTSYEWRTDHGSIYQRRHRGLAACFRDLEARYALTILRVQSAQYPVARCLKAYVAVLKHECSRNLQLLRILHPSFSGLSAATLDPQSPGID